MSITCGLFLACFFHLVFYSSYGEANSLHTPVLEIRYGLDEKSIRRKKYVAPSVQYVQKSKEEMTKEFPLICGRKDINWCHPLPNSFTSQFPTKGWVALVADISNTNCTCKKKIDNARFYNASAVIVLSDRFCGPIDLIALKITDPEDMQHLRQTCESYGSPNIGRVKCQILKHPKSNEKQFRVSKTSVLFVLVSFILLMCISLAWLVFYYVQRFRHIYRNDREEKQLLNAAKKAISKLKTETFNSANLTTEDDSCAVCLENYKDGENIRILSCKHLFHRTCIDPWLLNHRTCPMCKSNVLKSLGVEIPDNIDLSQIDEVNSRSFDVALPVQEGTPLVTDTQLRSPQHGDENGVMNLPDHDNAIPGTSQYPYAWSVNISANASIHSSTSSMIFETNLDRAAIALVSASPKV